MGNKIDIYDDFASQYAEFVAVREKQGIERDSIVPRLLDIIGDVTGLKVL
jgi:hypothetical protein